MIISTTNMASCFFTLNFPLIIFINFLAVSLSNGENTNYVACSIKYSCGQIQNIGYPFWGDNRPKFCGVSDFKLSCSTHENNHPVMNVMQNEHLPSSVISINESSHTIVISSRNMLEYCHSEDKGDMTFLTALTPLANYGIRLFYGCLSSCVSRHQSKNVSCTLDHDTYGTAYYLYNQSDTAKQCSCKSNVTIPVDKRWLDELIGSPTASLKSILTDRKIEMLYTANFTACSKCVESGGRCGSSEDPSSDQFVCYCRDGLQPLTCPDTEKKLKLLLGLGVGGAIFDLSAIIAICYCKKRKFGSSKFMTRSASLESSASELEKGSRYFGVPLFSYNELIAATHSFDQSNEIGSGGFGTVYYGKLKDGREVAVKRLFEKSYRRVEQFLNEVKILTHLRHQNLVPLFGCTSEKCRELLLVYEYVNNGTVADHLYGKRSKSGLLSWPLRMRIAIETATALSYLHASDIIHRDVKTNNILLDSNFSVKVADFGLSRLFPMDVTHVSTAPQGTPGYLDPEYHLCYKLTDKSDVYSFGVVLIELLSSLPAINMDRQKLEINLSHYAINRIQRCAFDELVDPQLGFALDFKVRRMTIAVAELAFQCLQHNKDFRPSMDEILENLKKIESVDYEALQAEEMARYGGEEMVKMRRSMPPSPSASEDDHAQLLNNHQLYLPSPMSVVDKWVSRSTASNNSK